MKNYVVLFYKTAPNSSDAKHLLKRFDIVSDSPSGALVLAEQQLQENLADADHIEVISTTHG